MEVRWSEKDRSGHRIYRKRVIGTVQQYPHAQAAREVATALVGHINAGSGGCKTTVEQICEHFEQRELRSGDSFRSFATVKTYRGYIRKWIKPRWGSRYLDEVKAVDIEAWLRRLPIARSSRAKIRSILSILFNHACRYELFDRNPMRFVRQGAKRRSAPNVLTAAEIKALVDHLPLRERTLVLLAAATGLRQSELFGLKWRDVDFKRGELSVIRSIVFGVVGRCKTESSQKPVPLHPLLGEALLAWRKTCKLLEPMTGFLRADCTRADDRTGAPRSFATTSAPLPRLSISKSASAGIPSGTRIPPFSEASEPSSK
jgi:integrase